MRILKIFFFGFLILSPAGCFFGIVKCGPPGAGEEIPAAVKIEGIRPGMNELKYRESQNIFLYVPEDLMDKRTHGSLLVVIHGARGMNITPEGGADVLNAAEQWIKTADRFHMVVLAPQFDRIRFPDYQRLSPAGERADLRLNELLRAVKLSLPNIHTETIKIFGFSGGGQFVHRYCALHPDKIDRAVAAGAGWYMWPDESLAYPVGIKSLNPDLRIYPDKFPGLNLMIIVGEQDTSQKDFETMYMGTDLVGLEGGSRAERGARWYGSLREYAARKKLELKVEFCLAPDTGHSISEALFGIAEAYLFN